MHTFLLDMLICPACHGFLDWHIEEDDGRHIEEAIASCTDCLATYPVQEGIGLFLTPDLPRNDLWEQTESGLMAHLRQNPEVERELVEPPLESLAPADRFFRAMTLEERGQFAAARLAQEAAMAGLYTVEYRAAEAKVRTAMLERLAATGDGPIVDLASGRGYLAEQMLRQLDRPVVVTDFSLVIQRRNRRYFEHLGLSDRLSLLAFDARRTPFADRAVETLTTYYGLANIEEPGRLLSELRRVVSGRLLACSLFYPEDDNANRAVVEEAGLATLLYRPSLLAQFAAAGWRVDIPVEASGLARPTPRGQILAGAGIDALPAVETTLTWCLLEAFPSKNR